MRKIVIPYIIDSLPISILPDYLRDTHVVREVQEVKEYLEGLIVRRAIGRDQLHDATVRFLQSIPFSKSELDNEIWIRHAEEILDNDWNEVDKFRYFFAARQTYRVTLSEKHSYDLISLVLRYKGDYWATADETEPFGPRPLFTYIPTRFSTISQTN